LIGAGKELWEDAVQHLAATGRDARIYRHPLLLVCRLYESASSQEEIGVNKLDAVRRWLHELGLTPATAGAGAEATTNDTAQSGRARIFSLIDGKAAGE
jgi:hypothetical protein